jgi:hypothetical protein
MLLVHANLKTKLKTFLSPDNNISEHFQILGLFKHFFSSGVGDRSQGFTHGRQTT